MYSWPHEGILLSASYLDTCMFCICYAVEAKSKIKTLDMKKKNGKLSLPFQDPDNLDEQFRLTASHTYQTAQNKSAGKSFCLVSESPRISSLKRMQTRYPGMFSNTYQEREGGQGRREVEVEVEVGRQVGRSQIDRQLDSKQIFVGHPFLHSLVDSSMCPD